MASRSLDCPRCRGTMERGFIVDESYGAQKTQKWVEGEPVYSLWTGLKLRGKVRLEVATYRCSRCGYLESYADR